ncbi:MAG: hypothetical protein PUC39_07670 [Lachnospiraceae bacterium]|nr:hypothetical protein [Lachnospiraceae bacterium]
MKKEQGRNNKKNKHRMSVMKMVMIFMVLCILCSFILNVLLYYRICTLKKQIQSLGRITTEQQYTGGRL